MLLRLRSDEQLLALFRAGNEDAFQVLHDRYRPRLLAYVRQMLPVGVRGDAEDALQDVFLRAYGALRADERPVAVRAWLYRVAHNRCIDTLRRPAPTPVERSERECDDRHDPCDEAERRETLGQLVSDLQRLPEAQRSCLLLRELEGLSYSELGVVLEATQPAVKSLLVRARMGLADAAEARGADCQDIRADLAASCERGVRMSSRARLHLRDCSACTAYHGILRSTQKQVAGLAPSSGPLAALLKLLGLSGSGAAAGSGVIGGGAASGTTLAGLAGGTSIAAKLAVVVCVAAVTTGEAVKAVSTAPARHAQAAPRLVAAAAGPTAAALRAIPASALHPRPHPKAAVAPPAVVAVADAHPRHGPARLRRGRCHRRQRGPRRAADRPSRPGRDQRPACTGCRAGAPAVTGGRAQHGQHARRARDDPGADAGDHRRRRGTGDRQAHELDGGDDDGLAAGRAGPGDGLQPHRHAVEERHPGECARGPPARGAHQQVHVGAARARWRPPAAAGGPSRAGGRRRPRAPRP